MSEYLKMVQTLAKPGADILATLTPEKAHMLHMTIGIVGEVGELVKADLSDDDTNVVEELGDIYFYLTGLRNVDDIDQFIFDGDVAPVSVNDVVIYSSMLLDQVKKYVVYNKPYDDTKTGEALAWFTATFAQLSCQLGIPFARFKQHNMDKLAERYKGYQYSDAAAQARADKGGSDD